MAWVVRDRMGNHVTFKRSHDAPGRSRRELTAFETGLLLRHLRLDRDFMLQPRLRQMAQHVARFTGAHLGRDADQKRFVAVIEHGLNRRLLVALRGRDAVNTGLGASTRPEPPEPEEPAPVTEEPAQDCWVDFVELLPTRKSTTEVLLEGKWVYIVSDAKVAVTIDATAKQWSVENELTGEHGTVTDGWVRVLPDREYRFFVSPIALSTSSLAHLGRHATDMSRLPVLTPSSGERHTVPLRDPMAWTVELNFLRYRPAIEKWRDWTFEESRAAELFIAGALKSLMSQDDDNLRIGKHPREGQPDLWLDAYKKHSDDLLEPAERAMAEIAKWCDSPEHRLIEASALETGGDDLAVILIQWATCLAESSQTRPGAQLITDVVADVDRVPRKLLMPEGGSPAKDLDFAQHRYLAIAGMSLLGDLAPAIAKDLRARPDAHAVLTLWFERLGNLKPIQGQYEQVYNNLKEGRKLTHKLRVDDKVRVVERLIYKSGKDRKKLVRLPRGVAASERLSNSYQRSFGKLVNTGAITLEVLNLGMALIDLLDDSESSKTTFLKAIAIGGAASDLSAVLAQSSSTIMGELTKRQLAAGLGIISGLCYYVDFIVSARDAAEKGDYDTAFGNALAAGGAAGVAVGSALMLSNAGATAVYAMGLSATGFGFFITVIGGVLIAIGSVLAEYWTDTAHEIFAQHCFLGNRSKSAEPVIAAWIPREWELPGTTCLREAQVLTALLSNFHLASVGFDEIRIRPGYIRSGDIFRIHIRQRYTDFGPPPLECMIAVDPASGDIREIAGNRELSRESIVRFNAAGRSQEIVLRVDEADRYEGVRQEVWARLESGHGFTVPPDDRDSHNVWSTVGRYRGPSLQGRTAGHSLDAAHNRSASEYPPPAGLRVFHD